MKKSSAEVVSSVSSDVVEAKALVTRKRILYPLALDRATNPISTIHRNLALQFSQHSSHYDIISFAHDVLVTEKLFEKSLSKKPECVKLVCVPKNKFMQAVAITVNSIFHINSWDAIHVVPNPALVPLVLVAKLFGRKVITTIHEAPSQTQKRNFVTRNLLLFLVKLSNTCVSVSKYVESQVLTKWNLDSVVIPNGIDTHYFSPNFADKKAVEHKYGLDTKTKKFVLFVGALIDGKGAEIVAETCIIRSDVSCLIVGKGPLKSKIQGIIGNSTHVKQIDFLSHEDVRVLFASADVFFFPSSIDSFGLVYLESLASGTPVLSVYDAAAPEIITQKEHGVLVRTPAAFAVSLTALLHAKSHRVQLADYVKKNFSWEIIFKKYEKSYGGLFE